MAGVKRGNHRKTNSTIVIKDRNLFLKYVTALAKVSGRTLSSTSVAIGRGNGYLSTICHVGRIPSNMIPLLAKELNVTTDEIMDVIQPKEPEKTEEVVKEEASEVTSDKTIRDILDVQDLILAEERKQTQLLNQLVTMFARTWCNK
jgi:hypothetical protein